MTTETTRTEIERRLLAGESLRAMAPGLGLDYDADTDADALLLPGWVAADESGTDVEYPLAGTAREAAQEYVGSGDWSETTSTSWHHVSTWRVGLRQVECAHCEAAARAHDSEGDPTCEDCAGDPPDAGVSLEPLIVLVRLDEDSHTITREPDEPGCSADAHDWRTPHAVVGGAKENPGCRGHGGGVIQTEVCAHCGAYMVTDTWAQDPQTGEQGLRSIEYRPADEASEAWLERRAARAGAR